MNYTKAFVKDIGEDDGILKSVVISDEGTDRHGDNVMLEGWDFENYLLNPVVLDQHGAGTGSAKQVIGKNLELRIEGGKLKATPQFAINESEDARTIYNLYKGGYLNAFSVGFIQKEVNGKVVNELLEYSAVAVPANPRAIVEIKSKGITPVNWKGEPIDSHSEGLTIQPYPARLKRKSKYLERLTACFG